MGDSKASKSTKGGFRVPGMKVSRIFPEWVYGDREWLTCLSILDSDILRGKQIVENYVDFERRRIDVADLLRDSGPWSTGERLLVQVAIDLFNGDGKADLKDIVDRIDTTGYRLILQALCLYRSDWEG